MAIWLRDKLSLKTAVLLSVAVFVLALSWPSLGQAASTLTMNQPTTDAVYHAPPIPFSATFSSTEGYSPAAVKYSVEKQNGGNWTFFTELQTSPADGYATNFYPTDYGTYRVTAKAYLGAMDTMPLVSDGPRQFSYQPPGGGQQEAGNTVGWLTVPPVTAIVGTVTPLSVTLTGSAGKVDLYVQGAVALTLNVPTSGSTWTFNWNPTNGSANGINTSVYARAYFSSGSPTQLDTSTEYVTVYSGGGQGAVTVTLDPNNPTTAAAGQGATLKATTTGAPLCVRIYVQPPAPQGVMVVSPTGSAGIWTGSLPLTAANSGANDVYARAFSDAACAAQLAESGHMSLSVSGGGANTVGWLTVPPVTAIVGTVTPLSVTVTGSAGKVDLYVQGAVALTLDVPTSGSTWTFNWNPTNGSANGIITSVYARAYFTSGQLVTSTEYVTVYSGGGQGDVTAPVISAVAAAAPTSSSVTVTWTTDEDADSRVEYGPTVTYGWQATQTPLAKNHSVPLTGLTASTTYHYKACSADAAGIQVCSGDYSFTTLGGGGGAVTVTLDPTNPTTAAAGQDATLKATTTGAPLCVRIYVQPPAPQGVMVVSPTGSAGIWTGSLPLTAANSGANDVYARAFSDAACAAQLAESGHVGLNVSGGDANATVTLVEPNPNLDTVPFYGMQSLNFRADATGVATVKFKIWKNSNYLTTLESQLVAGQYQKNFEFMADVTATDEFEVQAIGYKADGTEAALSTTAEFRHQPAADGAATIVLGPNFPTSGAIGQNLTLKATTTGAPLCVRIYVQPPAPQGVMVVSPTGSAGIWTGSLPLTAANSGANDVYARAFSDAACAAQLAESEHRNLNVGAVQEEAGPLTVVLTLPPAAAQLSNLATLSATTSRRADSVVFEFDPPLPQTAQLSAQGDANGLIWSRYWDTFTANNGPYQLKARATVAGVTAVSAPISINVDNPVSEELRPTTVTVTMIEPAVGQVSGVVTLVAETSLWVDAVNFTLRRRNVPADYVPMVLPGNPDETHKRWAADWHTAYDFDGVFDVVARAVSSGQRVGESAARTFESNNGLEPQAPPAGETLPEDYRQLTDETVVRPPVFVTLLELPPMVRGLMLVKAVVRGDVAVSLKIIIKGPAGQLEKPAGFIDLLGVWGALWSTRDSPDGAYELAAEATLPYGDVVRSAPRRVTVQNVMPAGDLERPIDSIATLPPAVLREAAKTVPAGTRILQSAEYVPSAPAEARLNAECVAAKVPADRCQAWLNRRYGTRECRDAGLRSREDCIAWLKLKFSDRIPGCRQPNSEACATELAQRTAGLISAAELTKLNDAVALLIGRTIRFRRSAGTAGQRPAAEAFTDDDQPVDETVAGRIPLRTDRDINLRFQASPKYVKTDAENSHQGLSAVLFIDSDGDGLSDDLERRLGTNPGKADTDGDGFDDATEIANGYNPLGPGKLGEADFDFAPVDEAMIAGAPLEQPLDAGTVDPEFTVDNAGIGGMAGGWSANFRGRGRPRQIITIYLYSDLPVVLTTTVGEDGNWSYDLGTELADGEHQVYVALNDNTGKISAKSEPLSFFVAEAKAVTEEEFFSEAVAAGLAPEAAAEAASQKYAQQAAASAVEPVGAMLKWYLVGAGALVVVAIIIGVMLFAKPRRRPPDQMW